MCGIAGGIEVNNKVSSLKYDVIKMSDSIMHRGPDESGLWFEDNIALSHRRLSILDLSPSGSQPMVSHNNRYVIVYNGEVYNFDEVRHDLNKKYTINWNGSSDTEVILQAISLLGLDQAIVLFNGMFSFALWDRRDKKLFLARDRFGEKPLYYYNDNSSFYFASEIRSFEVVKSLDLKIDQSAIGLQIQTGYIPAPNSIYTKIKKVLPGQIVEFSCARGVFQRQFWSIDETVTRAKSDQFTNLNDGLELLESSLREAVKARMRSDVPLGAFLSGGIDSSLVVALMQDQSDTAVNTFSIGFEAEGYNEAQFAKKVANYLNTNHHEHYVSKKDVLDTIPMIGSIFDEPFSDSSQIPTYLVSKIARQNVTVCLSGDGGDELFCGYKRYHAAVNIWKKISFIPCRRIIALLLKKSSPDFLELLFFFLRPYAERYGRRGHLGHKIKRFSDWIIAQSVDELYQLSMRHWPTAEIMKDQQFYSNHFDDMKLMNTNLEAIERMMLLDTKQYLSGDILTKVDRTAMAVSLEGRIPLLDPKIFELAWRFKLSDKSRNGNAKWPLKQILYKYVPQELFDRPKLGFGVPIHLWLKEELRDWAGDILLGHQLKDQDIFNHKQVMTSFDNHISGKENNASALWNVLMTQSWFEASHERKGRL